MKSLTLKNQHFGVRDGEVSWSEGRLGYTGNFKRDYPKP